ILPNGSETVAGKIKGLVFRIPVTEPPYRRPKPKIGCAPFGLLLFFLILFLLLVNTVIVLTFYGDGNQQGEKIFNTIFLLCPLIVIASVILFIVNPYEFREKLHHVMNDQISESISKGVACVFLVIVALVFLGMFFDKSNDKGTEVKSHSVNTVSDFDSKFYEIQIGMSQEQVKNIMEKSPDRKAHVSYINGEQGQGDEYVYHSPKKMGGSISVYFVHDRVVYVLKNTKSGAVERTDKGDNTL
ncbi:MAG: hypothetical protein LBQ54_04760, partial [Planctomycetaceae bacterium]|nr:hypothetical protein [Planctomycetaceae bacterium]